MKKLCIALCLLLCLTSLTGCAEVTDTINVDAIRQQAETIAQQIDVEAIVTDIIENIDWEQLKEYSQQGYDSLTAQFPALKGENIQIFLKENGLSLLNRFIESSDDAMQENARKLGEIIKILNPELADEVDAVIS